MLNLRKKGPRQVCNLGFACLFCEPVSHVCKVVISMSTILGVIQSGMQSSAFHVYYCVHVVCLYLRNC